MSNISMSGRAYILAYVANALQVGLKAKDIYCAIYELGIRSAMPTKIVKHQQGFIMQFDSVNDRDKVLACKIIHVGGIELELEHMLDPPSGDQQLYHPFLERGDGHGSNYETSLPKTSTEYTCQDDSTSLNLTDQQHHLNIVLPSCVNQSDPSDHLTDTQNRICAARYTNPELYGFSRGLLDEGKLFLFALRYFQKFVIGRTFLTCSANSYANIVCHFSNSAAELFNIPLEDLKEFNEGKAQFIGYHSHLVCKAV
jgi:hypothetical protein